MDRRYRLLQDHGKRGIDEFNAQKDVDSMPYIVIVVDEFADLMMVAGKDVEALIQRLTQMARAVGIHLGSRYPATKRKCDYGCYKGERPNSCGAYDRQSGGFTYHHRDGRRREVTWQGRHALCQPQLHKAQACTGCVVKRGRSHWVLQTILREARREPEYNEEVLGPIGAHKRLERWWRL
jgi:hypothetical protein